MRRCILVHLSSVAATRTPSLLLYVGSTTRVPWSGDQSRSGSLGGSETNAGELAAVFRARGWAVVLSGHVEDGLHDGVEYVRETNLRVTDWWGNPLFDHIIISRVVEQYVARHKLAARRSISVWSQDYVPRMESTGPQFAKRKTRGAYLADVEEMLLAAMRNGLTRVLALSPWHLYAMRKEFFPSLHAQYPHRWGWMPNAIDAERWVRAEAAFAAAGESKINGRFIYTSVAERGLVRLLRAFPDIRAAVPGATLLVATYDPSGVPDEAWTLMREQSGHVTFAGALSKDALYREVLRAEVWLYPTTVRETCAPTIQAHARSRRACVCRMPARRAHARDGILGVRGERYAGTATLRWR